MLFGVNGQDYTRKIISGTYSVNKEDVYKKWTDANYIEHRNVYRSQISGSFTMYFRDQNDFHQFIMELEAVKNINGFYVVGIAVNNTLEYLEDVNVYIEFNPKRQQRVLGDAWFPEVQIKIEER